MAVSFLSKTIFEDNVELRFGDGEDLRIYHDGSSSRIVDGGTGNLLISGTNLILNDTATGENFLRAVSNGAVQIYHNGSEKFITTSTGIDVTGTVNLDNLTINGGQGSDGQVLTSTGSGVAWENAASGGGTVTSVGISPGTGLDVSNSPVTVSGDITLNLDLSEFTDMTGDIDPSVDEIILLDNGSERRKRFAEIFGSNAYNSTTIPTNNNQLTNGAGYITDGNTGWNNTYGFITASSSDTLTNKGGNISQWTNDSGYITSSSLPTVNNGTLTLSTSTGLDGGASFTANQSGNSTFTVSLDLSELTDMTAAISPTVDEIILLDNGAERRKRFSEIFGSNAYNSTTIPTNYLKDDAFDSGIGLYLQGGSFNAGTDTVTAPLVIDEEDFIYTKDGGYLRKLIGKTSDQIQIGQGGTSLISSINFLPGTAGNSAVKINSNTVWNAGNDGAGSGLDADLLDGLQTTSSGNRWGVVPTVGSSGVLEAGKYIDFHESDTTTSDYNYRITSTSGRLYFSGDIEVDGGDIYINDSNTRLTEGSTNSIRLQTNNGYVDVGPQDANHCHFTTDRLSGFIFNKKVQVGQGTLRSDNQDLVLSRNGSTTARVVIGSGETRNDQNFRINASSGNEAVLTLEDGDTSGYIGSKIDFSNTSGSIGSRIQYISNPGGSELRFYTEGDTSTIAMRVKKTDTYFNDTVHADQYVGQTYVITGSVDHTFQNSYAYWYYNWHQSTSFSSSRYAENSFVAPFDGYIGSFYHRGVGLDSSNATQLALVVYINGTGTSISSSNVSLSGSGSNKVFKFTNTNVNSYDFYEGDRIEMTWNINSLFGESCYAVELVRKET